MSHLLNLLLPLTLLQRMKEEALDNPESKGPVSLHGIRGHMSNFAAMLGGASKAWRHPTVSDVGASHPPSFIPTNVDETRRETNAERTRQEGNASESVEGSQTARCNVPGFSSLFSFTLATGPRRSLSLTLSDPRVYEPQGGASRSFLCIVVAPLT